MLARPWGTAQGLDGLSTVLEWKKVPWCPPLAPETPPPPLSPSVPHTTTVLVMRAERGSPPGPLPPRRGNHSPHCGGPLSQDIQHPGQRDPVAHPALLTWGGQRQDGGKDEEGF